MSVLALFALLGPARADIAVDQVPLPERARHELRIEGLEAFPDAVLLVHDGVDGGTIQASRTFQAGGQAQQVLHGGGKGGPTDLQAPAVHLLSKAAHDAWWAVAFPEIEKQVAACAKEGPLCMMGGHFAPSYSAPTGTLDCALPLPIARLDEAGGAAGVVDVVRLVEAGPAGCRLEKLGREELEAEGGGGPCGCTAAGPGLAPIGGLGLLALLGRRRRGARAR